MLEQAVRTRPHGELVPEPTLEHFADPAVQSLLDRVELEFDSIPIDAARVELSMADGRTIQAEGTVDPAEGADPTDRLRAGTEGLLSDSSRDRLEQLLDDLEHVDDVGKVLACTVPTCVDESQSRSSVVSA